MQGQDECSAFHIFHKYWIKIMQFGGTVLHFSPDLHTKQLSFSFFDSFFFLFEEIHLMPIDWY
jgi:hypothetical protein